MLTIVITIGLVVFTIGFINQKVEHAQKLKRIQEKMEKLEAKEKKDNE